MMLVAFAVVSAAAMAQDFDRHGKWAELDSNGKSKYDLKREVCWQAEDLSGGDKYDFEVMLERMNPNIEDAMISGLFCARRQAVIVRHQAVVAVVQSMDAMADANMAPDASAVIAEENDGSMRPMRMKMQPNTGRDIDYDTAFDILTSDLNSSQSAELSRWWDNDKNMRQKDVVVRMLKNDAKMADEPIYASFYTRHYDWITK
jgi:hypothetical protein